MRKQNCRKCIQLDDTLKSLIFIYFTTITKQVIQLILIMLVGTDVCVRMVFVWEETGVPGGNPPVWLGDHMTWCFDIYNLFVFPHGTCTMLSVLNKLF